MTQLITYFKICKKKGIYGVGTMFEAGNRACVLCIMCFLISSKLFEPLSPY
jgi:hypothetical protein